MDQTTMTNILLGAFGGLITILLATIGFLISRYVKSTDAKFKLLFEGMARQSKTTTNLRFLLAWLVTVLDTKGCIDSGDQPILDETDDDDSTDPVKALKFVMAQRRKSEHSQRCPTVPVQGAHA